MGAGERWLRSVDGLMSTAVGDTLAALESELTDADTAAIRLARLYATQIDETPDTLEHLGPKLLAALDALGATPKARAARKGGVSGGSQQGGALAALRDARPA